MTVHKAQGATLPDGVVLYLRECFAPALGYVALSRVPNRTNLHIVNGIKSADLTPVDCSWFQAEN